MKVWYPRSSYYFCKFFGG